MVGELMVLSATLFFAMGSVLIKKGTGRSSQDNGVFLSIVFTAVLAGVLELVFIFYRGWPTVNANGIAWFAFSGVLLAAVGRNFFFASIRTLGSVRGSAVNKMNAFFAMLIGIFILDESLTFSLLFGSLFIFVGLFLMFRQSLKIDRAAVEVALAAKPGLGDMALSQTAVGANQATIAMSGGAGRVRGLSLREHFASFRGSVAMGYLWGILGALGYAVGNVSMKKGLLEVGDPFLGTMIGALAGILFFSLVAVFDEQHRVSITSFFRRWNPWFVFSGVAVSVGQILFILSLYFIEVSRAMLIATIDTILAIFLSALVFRTQEGITRLTILATCGFVLGAAVIIIR